MGKPYSEDLRRNVVHAIESGHTYEETAELCGVSASSVSRFLTRWRRTGSVSPKSLVVTKVMLWNGTGIGSRDGWVRSLT